MARTLIHHVCLYCRRGFKGKSNQYITHLQKHRRRYHKGKYQILKLSDTRKLFIKYSKHGKNQANSTKDGYSSFKQETKKETTSSTANSTATGYTLLPEDILFSPTPKKDNTFNTSQLQQPVASNSRFAPIANITNPSIPHHNSLLSTTPSTRNSTSRTEKKYYKCSFCEKSFSGGSHLLLHERTHTGEKPHACRFCPKSFAQKGYLKIHERIHTGERPFKCVFCDKAFCTKEDLRRHERIHTGEKPYKCKVCNRGFSQRSYRNKHESIHAGNRPFGSKPPNWDQAVEQVNAGWDPVAGGIPQLPPILLESLHGADVEGGLSPALIKQLTDMNATQQQQTTPGRGRGRPKGMANRQTYICRFCSRDCRSSSQLKQHERTHTGEKPFTCKFCQKSFSQRGYARIHERIHTGEKPFPCKVCDKAFAAKEDLRRHQRTHTGEKPYKCELCNKAFAQNSALIGHRKTHLNEISTLDYSSHSFVGMQQPHLNYPQFLGANNTFSSAHILQQMATEAGGALLNQNLNVLSYKENPDATADTKPNKDMMDGLVPPHFMLSNHLPGSPNVTLADNRVTDDAKEMPDSGRKKGINDIAARLLATKEDSSDLLSRAGLRVNHLQQDKTGANCSTVDQTDSVHVSEHSLQPPNDAKSLYHIYENTGISIVDHIRMQLSMSSSVRPIQTNETPTLAHGKTFVIKKNKINNLASQLLSAKSQPTALNLTTPPVDESKVNNFSIYPRKLPENGSIYHRAAQLMQPSQYRPDDQDDIENRTNSTPGTCIGTQQSLTSTAPSLGDTKEQKPTFVSKKNNINDLASQLLSVQTLKENQTNISGRDAVSSPPARDGDLANDDFASDISQINNHLESSMNISIYHRAALQMQASHSRTDFIRQEMTEQSPNLPNNATTIAEMPNNHLANQREVDNFQTLPDIQANSLSVKCSANVSSDLEGNLSSKSEQVESAPINLIKDCVGTDNKINNIAAHLISTQLVKSQSVDATMPGMTGLTGLRFQEEMGARKQKRGMVTKSFLKNPVRASITSICRPLRGIPTERGDLKGNLFLNSVNQSS